MKRPVVFALIASLAFTMTACPGPWADRNGKFQNDPINLEPVNSEFDDYNSNLPLNRGSRGDLVFSSKRKRKNVFNLVVEPVELRYNDQTYKLSVVVKDHRWSTSLVPTNVYYWLAYKANQDCNVLGPISYVLDEEILRRGGIAKNRVLMLYADDSAGDLQIKFVHNFNDEEVVEGPFEVKWLNTPKDDAYPTFNSDFSQLYFCSNRDGDFDIFEVKLPAQPEKLLETLLSEKPQTILKNTQLSTPYDDKCPYFIGGWGSQVMYFTSNRPGGEGGFDIYYSLLDGTKWREPVNLGNRINTKYDEYRPIVPQQMIRGYNYHLGIFSSNRPGGKGGFDLYMAGFLKDRETNL